MGSVRGRNQIGQPGGEIDACPLGLVLKVGKLGGERPGVIGATGAAGGEDEARKIGQPPAWRRNASASARAARRVGSRIRPSAAASGSLPAPASQAAAMLSRNGLSGGTAKRFIGGDRGDPASR